MAKSYVVKGAYVTAQVTADQGPVVLGFTRGAPLPASVPKATIDHLLSVDLITESSDDLDLFPAPADTSAIGAPGTEQTSTTSTGADKPAGNASQAEWADYAQSQGMPADEATATSRDDLRDKYAG